jgi:hypothetical protein
MITTVDDTNVLREKIKGSLDVLSTDELKELHNMIARFAAEKATKLADIDWQERNISRDSIKEAVRQSRASRSK